jgi:hypothetical protein
MALLLILQNNFKGKNRIDPERIPGLTATKCRIAVGTNDKVILTLRIRVPTAPLQ